MLLAYLVGSLLFLWPIPVELHTSIWGDRFDAWTTLWLIGHLAERLQTASLDPITHEILYPIGYNIWSFGHVALQAIGAVMVRLGVPVVTTYNLLFIGGIWSSATAAHLLGRELTGSHLAAAIGGIVFATSPYLYAEGGAGCIELVAAGLLPLHTWSLIRLARVPSWKRFTAAALILALIGPFNWYYTLFAGLFGLGFCTWRAGALGRALFAPQHRAHRNGIGLILLSMVTAAVINLPLIDAARQETPTRPSIDAERFADAQAWDRASSITNGSANLESLTEAGLIELDALQVHLNSTSILGLVEADFTVNPLGVTPGLLAYSIAILGIAVAGRRTWGWLALAVAFTLFSMGPYLNLAGDLVLPKWAIQFELPYRWASDWIPFFEKAYRPYRFAVLVLQCTAIIGAIGAATLIRHGQRTAVLIGVLVVGAVGFTQPLWTNAASRPTQDASTPTIYGALASAPPGAVIEVPLQYQPITIATAQQQFYQLTHGHPLLNTNQLIRRPDLLAFRDYTIDNSFLLAILDLGRPSWPITVQDQDIQALIDDGFRYVVVHDRVAGDQTKLAGELTRADLVNEGARGMLTELLGPAAMTSDTTHIYDLTLAQLKEGRSQTFTDDGLENIYPPYDIVETGLLLDLQPGETAHLHRGEGRQLVVWAIQEEQSELNLEISDGTTQTLVPVALEAGFWRRTTADLPGGEVSISLRAGDLGTTAALTAMQVIQ